MLVHGDQGSWQKCKTSARKQKNWNVIGDEVTNRVIFVGNGKTAAPYPPIHMASTGRLFTRSTVLEEMCKQNMAESVLNGEMFPFLKKTEERWSKEVNAICSNTLPKLSLNVILSDNSSSRKSAVPDLFFSSLHYPKSCSKSDSKVENRGGEDQSGKWGKIENKQTLPRQWWISYGVLAEVGGCGQYALHQRAGAWWCVARNNTDVDWRLLCAAPGNRRRSRKRRR